MPALFADLTTFLLVIKVTHIHNNTITLIYIFTITLIHMLLVSHIHNNTIIPNTVIKVLHQVPHCVNMNYIVKIGGRYIGE